MRTPHCENFKYIIDYVSFIECGLKAQSHMTEVFAVFGFLILGLYLLLCIAVIANSYFGPALKSIAKKMRMNEHLAGVTLLAFGNSAADFSAQLTNTNIHHLFMDTVSSAIFATLISGGLICIFYPFQMERYDMVIDILFFIIGVMYLEYILASDSTLTLSWCVGPIIIYIIYLAINITDTFLEKKYGNAPPSILILATKSRASFGRSGRPSNAPRVQSLRSSRISGSQRSARQTTYFAERRETVDEAMTRVLRHRKQNPKNLNLLNEFISAIVPIQATDWERSGKFIRTFLIIRAPLVFLCQLFIPVVNVEHEKHGWSKLLNCLHIVVTPLLPALILSVYGADISFTVLLVTIPVAIAVFLHSRTDIPPPYHFVFTLVCGVTSMLLIFVCAREISEIVVVIGMVVGLSESFITITVNSWGSSVGMLVTNMTLAHHGYERMAFASCYGGPFFMLIMSNGIIMTSQHLLGHEFSVSNGLFYENSYIFFMLSLVSTLIWAFSFDFVTRPSVGVFNFMLYLLFIIYAVLAEKEVIHSFTRDEHIDVV
ncbi:mitochondrial sodium/calcium exchanger protein-like [Scaptodrosophila lebanonensis]|uniref:Mitochondrial sodium/calcium exchanger protein-like n=1 Tax=Drosophila lebanonensis TaxID=7225 RepID=A0A6J2UGL0_DROLE|nr:mitochondrial sodium/calcium exchanger protein-like [Scaptodrosophila lebanonensis]